MNRNTSTQNTRDFGSRADTVVLAILIVAMCSQIDPLSLGRDTLAEGLGYATKTLKIALCDIALVLAMGWFILRTTQQKAWRKIWWPPLPCWALIFAMIISMIHAPNVLNGFAEVFEKTGGLKGIIKGIAAKEPKEAIAEIIQYSFYFVVAPLLFVNWIHDRRSDVLIDRKKLALWAFCGAVGLNVLAALIQLVLWDKTAPRGLWTSANIYGVFVATSIPLLLSLAPRNLTWREAAFSFGGIFLVIFPSALLTLTSPGAVVGLLIGVGISFFLTMAGQKSSLRYVNTAYVLCTFLIVLFVSWNFQSDLKTNRNEHLNVASATEVVKKQYIEWYAATRWSVPQGADLTGGPQQLHHFETGVGPGNYQGNIGPYYGSLPNEEKMPPDSNNLYLVQAVSIGILGLAALIWMSTHFAHQARIAKKLNPDDWLAHGALGSLCAFAVVVLFHAGIVRGMSLVLAFVFALCIIARETAEAKAASKEKNFSETII